MSSENQKNSKWFYIVGAVLIIIVIVQGFFLFTSNKESTLFTKKQCPFPQIPKTFSPQQIPNRMQQNMQGLPNDPLDEFDLFSRRINKFMNQAFTQGAPLMQSVFQNNLDFTPAVDIEETDNAYIVEGDLPGLDKNKIDITVRNNLLTIRGVREVSTDTQDNSKGYFSQERSYGSFSRSLALPGPVDESRVTAEYKNGVIKITLPKLAQDKELQKVQVK